jgi:hypothetical protein
MSEETPDYRAPGRPGLTASEVGRLCDEMLKRGERPTIEKIRKALGGSPNTITTLLDAWWDKLGERLERGTAAFERIPAHLALNVEAFFLTVLDEARALAAREQDERKEAIAKTEQQVAVREYVLHLREKEMKALLEQRDQMIVLLVAQLTDRRNFAEKILATKDSLDRQVRELRITVETLQAKLAASLGAPRPRPRSARPARAVRTVKVVKRRQSKKAVARRKVAARRRAH